MTEQPTPQPDPKSNLPQRPDASKRRSALIQIGIAVVVAVIVFGFILPQVIDYQSVAEILGSLDAGSIAILVVAGLLLYVPEGWLYSLCLPGMGLGRGISSWIASTAAASTTPGVDVAVRFGMGRSYGGTVDQTVLWIPLTGIFDNLVKFSLPVLAIITIAVRGDDLGGLEWVALIAGAVLIVGTIIVVRIFRSEPFAISIAKRVVSVANAVLRRFNRPEIEDPTPRVQGFRTYAGDTIRSRWALALIASATGKLMSLVILVIALRIVGLEADVLPLWEIFVVWSIVLLITSIPITPGGIGIAALAYVWLFTGLIGDENADLIAAGVVLFRLVQWALPIVIGWPLIWYWRRQVARGDLPDPFAP